MHTMQTLPPTVAVRGPDARTNFPALDYLPAEVSAMETLIRLRHPEFPLDKIQAAYRWAAAVGA